MVGKGTLRLKGGGKDGKGKGKGKIIRQRPIFRKRWLRSSRACSWPGALPMDVIFVLRGTLGHAKALAVAFFSAV